MFSHFKCPILFSSYLCMLICMTPICWLLTSVLITDESPWKLPSLGSLCNLSPFPLAATEVIAIYPMSAFLSLPFWKYPHLIPS